MKRKAAQAEITSHPSPQLTAWNLHLRKYAATEGRYTIAVSVIMLNHIRNVECSLYCFQMGDKLFKLVRLFLTKKPVLSTKRCQPLTRNN